MVLKLSPQTITEEIEVLVNRSIYERQLLKKQISKD